MQESPEPQVALLVHAPPLHQVFIDASWTQTPVPQVVSSTQLVHSAVPVLPVVVVALVPVVDEPIVEAVVDPVPLVPVVCELPVVVVDAAVVVELPPVVVVVPVMPLEPVDVVDAPVEVEVDVPVVSLVVPVDVLPWVPVVVPPVAPWSPTPVVFAPVDDVDAPVLVAPVPLLVVLLPLVPFVPLLLLPPLPLPPANSQVPWKQSWPPTHAWQAAPFSPQAVGEDGWQMLLASQQPAQFEGPQVEPQPARAAAAATVTTAIRIRDMAWLQARQPNGGAPRRVHEKSRPRPDVDDQPLTCPLALPVQPLPASAI